MEVIGIPPVKVWTVERRCIDNGWTRGVNWRESGCSRGRGCCWPTRPQPTVESGRGPMGPAEIVASLKELCASKGPRLCTEQIVAWIEAQHGFETDAELILFAKKMKARQYARLLD